MSYTSWDEYDEDGQYIGQGHIDEHTGLVVHADDEWAEERIRIQCIVDARATLAMPDASPERKAFARQTLRDCSMPDDRVWCMTWICPSCRVEFMPGEHDLERCLWEKEQEHL